MVPLATPVQRRVVHQPSVCYRGTALQYFDVPVDDTLGYAQRSSVRLGRVRRILLFALYDMLRPLDSTDE
jgi:hypothetical protein